MNFKSTACRAAIAAALLPPPAAALAQTQLAAAAPSGSPVTSAPAEEQVGDTIVVTGTRATGITAVESATPIKVLDAATLSRVGQPNLQQVLTQLVPSFTAQAFGGDTANLTLSARLRGLSPNHTLVLVNGKRRHGTANLAVLGSAYQGSAAPDLDMITPLSIQRIEVLEQGAAAQYGSDAIAGVINIILKDDKEGIEGIATAGEYYKTGGKTYSGSLHVAAGFGDGGYANLTLFHRYQDFTQVGGIDRRVTDPSGTLLPLAGPGVVYGISAIQRQLYPAIDDFPYVNKINGNARSRLTVAQFNAGYDFGDVEVYSFGTYGRRIASAYENLRVPTRVSRTVAGVTTYFDPDPLPGGVSNGFSPREGLREDDYGITGGIRGEDGFRWDLSTTWGQDKNRIFTLDTANASLFADTGATPQTFYDGFFRNTEWTSNLDLAKEFDVGMASPMTVALGAEYRKNIYTIGAGEPLSYYKEGAQSYPGFRPSDAGRHSRDNESLYLDVALEPIEALKLDGAVRYEHYSDFGSKVTFKATGRYDFTEAVAVRGTVSTGFRAPTLAESFYSATNVSPTSAFVQLPANSAAAGLLGFTPLKPEKSTTYSAGVVLRPARRLTITVDAYQVKIRDRILGTGSLYGSGGGTITINGQVYSVNFPAVTQAIIANGNVLDPTVSQTGINIFTNGADTRTRGIDFVASYFTDFGAAGTATWTLSANYNKTKITSLDIAPASLTPRLVSNPTVLAPTPIALFDPSAQSNLEDASPRVKVVGNMLYTLDRFSLNARGTLYGKTSNFTTPDGASFYKQKIKSAVIVDLEASYNIADPLTLSVGANNLFNKRPPRVALVPGTTNFTLVNGGNVIDAPLTFSSYGINGGYYYARVNVKF